MKNIFLTSILLIFFGNAFAQEFNKKTFHLSGNLEADSKLVSKLDFNQINNSVYLPEENKKSPFLAGLFSLLVPGAGEIYTEEYIKAAVFLALEAAVVTTAIIYDKKGNDQTEMFENFADKNWSVVKYAEWLMQYKAELGLPEDCNITINPDESLPPWERVNWEELNHCESRFSHKLPPHGNQQYYELIGKYPQYSPGWPNFSGESDYHIVPQIYLDYSAMRGKANDYYNVASKAVIGIYINHFLSGIDAVWSAISYNKDLALNIRIQNVNLAADVEWIPTLNIKYSF
ncbi:MAG: hypothetical protein HXY49_03115 [Ignavibacteriaceae bacterium]|nr:hypothetical protein [Ignavibacteriaceae bacterium]